MSLSTPVVISGPRRDALRRALDAALPHDVAETPEPRNLYVPPRHARALLPERSLVVGIRGAGKSVWWKALQSPAHRHVVAFSSLTPLDEKTEVAAGFGEVPSIADYPDKRTLGKMLDGDHTPADIWRTVIAHHTWARQHDSPIPDLETWAQRITWIEDHPEQTAHAFEAYDEALTRQERQKLILFDALDRTADDWANLRQLLRGLLEQILELRGFRSIRAKVFVRPDMLDDPQVASFPDASKVLAGRVELKWARADLYGLLFQRMGNSPQEGLELRQTCEALGSGHWPEANGIWQVPKALREDEELQRKIFHTLAGPWMGTDRKRGFPYTWLPNHLGDAAEQVSPRSFLSALRTAAEDPLPEGWAHPLHYDGIKRGVQEASRIRVNEIREDFFWISTVMEPLRGLAVPCDFSEIRGRWDDAAVLSRLEPGGNTVSGLLPKRLELGLKGLRDDLLDLAVFSQQKDGRINMPDVYRVGFGLGRRGGVKPIR